MYVLNPNIPYLDRYPNIKPAFIADTCLKFNMLLYEAGIRKKIKPDEKEYIAFFKTYDQAKSFVEEAKEEYIIFKTYETISNPKLANLDEKL